MYKSVVPPIQRHFHWYISPIKQDLLEGNLLASHWVADALVFVCWVHSGWFGCSLVVPRGMLLGVCHVGYDGMCPRGLPDVSTFTLGHRAYAVCAVIFEGRGFRGFRCKLVEREILILGGRGVMFAHGSLVLINPLYSEPYKILLWVSI